MTNDHHLKPAKDRLKFAIQPQAVGWDYLGYQAVNLEAGETYSFATGGSEAALVPLAGKASLKVEGQTFDVARESVFKEKPHVLYMPPNCALEVQAGSGFEFAVGTAPAEGKYPLRLFEPSEMRVEVRGGGAAVSEVHHILSHPLPAERLILFEVYVPGGMWSGWPPHRHDEVLNSPYLEETYHFRFDKPSGFGLHHNYSPETDFEEVFRVNDDDLVLVTQGYHPVAASPGSTMYFLNYLAGKLVGEKRATPPVDDPDHAWLKDNWDAYDVELPIME